MTYLVGSVTSQRADTALNSAYSLVQVGLTGRSLVGRHDDLLDVNQV